VKKLISLAGLAAVASLVVVALAPAAQRAETYKVSAGLNSRQETPRPKRTVTARGSFSGTYVENRTGAVLKWKLTFTRLTGSATAAHIHSGKRGVAGPVIVPPCGPCKSGQTGTTKISKAVVSALEKNGAYVNVHTAKNPGGEIRGQVSVKEG
jgi:CHRD domain-containing protein